MPEVNNHNEKPWYRKSSSWAWITIGVLILTYIIVSAVTDAQEKRAKQNQYKPKSYKEVFTPEEAKKMDIGGHIDGPGDWKPDPNAAKRTKEFIEKGGNADPVGMPFKMETTMTCWTRTAVRKGSDNRHSGHFSQ